MNPTYRPAANPALALLLMRVGAGLLLLVIHGLPKLWHWQTELTVIEDPFGLGAVLTLSFAVFAEVICALLLILGIWARLACVPILAVLLVSVTLVHPEWSLAEGQFAWLMIVLFGGLSISGAGPYRVTLFLRHGHPAATGPHT